MTLNDLMNNLDKAKQELYEATLNVTGYPSMRNQFVLIEAAKRKEVERLGNLINYLFTVDITVLCATINDIEELKS